MAGISVTPQPSTLDPMRRRSDLWNALGVIAVSEPGLTNQGGVNPTSQTIVAGAIYLYAGQAITNIIVGVQTAGTSTAPTGIYLGLWDSASTPNCLAATANLAADARWTSQGWKVNALSAAYTPTTSGIYYAAFLQNGAFAGTNLGVASSQGSGGTSATLVSARPWTALGTGKTTMAALDTGTYSVAGSIPCFAVS